MKKGFLLLGATALCVIANAQQVAGWVSADNAEVAAAWGWDVEGDKFDKDKTSHDAGTLMIDTEKVTLRTTFTDDCSVSSINKLSLDHYVVDGVVYTSEGGANNIFNGGVGNTNPAAIADINAPVVNKGWILDYEVKEDGWLTVFAAPSMNKNFYVMAGEMGDGEVSVASAIGYELYLQMSEPVPAELELDRSFFTIKLPVIDDPEAPGMLNTEAPDIAQYCENGNGPIMWPIRIIKGDPAYEVPENSEGKKNYGTVNGAAVFPVLAGVHYYVFATGSKLTGGPFVWTKNKPTQVAFIDDNDEGSKVYDLIGTYAGVEGVAAEEDVNAPIYNMMGVRVNADAKGILIQNGKKFIRK